MKLRLSSVVVLALAAAMSAGPTSADLEGCVEPTAVAAALAKLHASDWRIVSLDQLRSIWPTELAGKDCNPAGCSDVWSADRIINGHCECCATFFFKVQGSKARPRTEWLDNLVISYSAPQRAEVVTAARKFASALGLKGTELEEVGKESMQNFHWESLGKNGRELAAIQLRFTHQGDLWELYLNSGQNIME